ncbi:MAG: hypothetical protein ACRDAJ_06950 [Serratia fonticola]
MDYQRVLTDIENRLPAGTQLSDKERVILTTLCVWFLAKDAPVDEHSGELFPEAPDAGPKDDEPAVA